MKTLLTTLLLGIAACVMADAAGTQSYPSRPIRLVVPHPPGGGSDTFARIVAPRLTEIVGQQVIVDNRSGAAGNIATEIVAAAQPDGYTLLWGHSTPLVVNPALYKNLAVDTGKNFAPIAFLASAQLLVVVQRSVPANSVQELVTLLRSKPGGLPYGSAGTGSPNHLAAELFKSRANVDMIHVPYKGGGPASLALLSDEVKIIFGSFASLLPHVRTGKIKALAVTGPKRSSEAPAVPTMQESGFPGFDVRVWYGVLAPARTPHDIMSLLNRGFMRILSMREVRDALKREGFEPSGSTPAEFAARIKAEKALWAKIIKQAGIRAE